MTEKHRPRHQARHPLSFHHDSDDESCVLPEDRSHSQGQAHAAEYLHKRDLKRQGETAKNRKADSRRAGSGY
jgi:hypothetical protein